MARDDQADLFGTNHRTIYSTRTRLLSNTGPMRTKVRARLHRILAEARAAQKLPWEPTRVSLYRTIFPQMTNWLPDEEAAKLRFEFEIGTGAVEGSLV